MKYLTGFLIGLAVAGCFAFFGKDSYDSSLNKPLLDSLKAVRGQNVLIIDSLTFVNDSLSVEALKRDTVIVKIKQHEKVWINSVDTMHNDSVISAIRRNLIY